MWCLCACINICIVLIVGIGMRIGNGVIVWFARGSGIILVFFIEIPHVGNGVCIYVCMVNC